MYAFLAPAPFTRHAAFANASCVEAPLQADITPAGTRGWAEAANNGLQLEKRGEQCLHGFLRGGAVAHVGVTRATSRTLNRGERRQLRIKHDSSNRES